MCASYRLRFCSCLHSSLNAFGIPRTAIAIQGLRMTSVWLARETDEYRTRPYSARRTVLLDGIRLKHEKRRRKIMDKPGCSHETARPPIRPISKRTSDIEPISGSVSGWTTLILQESKRERPSFLCECNLPSRPSRALSFSQLREACLAPAYHMKL
jgi:hypothetical protein